MATDSLIGPINDAIVHSHFIDFYKNRLNSSHVRELYDRLKTIHLNSTDKIVVRQRELDAITQKLGPLLGTYMSPTGFVGNGLYTLTGSLASPRHPSCKEYAKILVLAATRIGAERVTQLLGDWIEGKRLRVFLCVLLKGVSTEGKLQPVPGMLLDTLPNNGNFLPRSLRLQPHDHRREQFLSRAILSVECKTEAGLYDPELIQGKPTFPPAPLDPPCPVNQNLSTVTFPSFCRALSLTINNNVDWFILWHDYGDVEAFFLNPGFWSQRQEVRSESVVRVTEEDVRTCLDLHDKLTRRSDLDLPIARWLRTKRVRTQYEQLIELRIALETILLNDTLGTSEKKFQLANRGAWLLGETFDDRLKYFETLKQVYDYASRVIHGGKPKAKAGRDLQRDMVEAQDLCRDAILKFSTDENALDSSEWAALILGKKA